jgi:TM2 domain-containing membrane protein YozV
MARIRALAVAIIQINISGSESCFSARYHGAAGSTRSKSTASIHRTVHRTIKGEEVNSPMTHSTKPYANRKSLTVAYLLLIFIGGAGAHRFYAAKTPSAVGMLVLMLIGWGLNEYTIGDILLGALAIWLLVDIFLIPGWIRDENKSRT